MADVLDDRKARLEEGLCSRARQRAGLPTDRVDREAIDAARVLAVPGGGVAEQLAPDRLLVVDVAGVGRIAFGAAAEPAEVDWRAVPGLDDCASCGRRDLPLRLQVSGAYSLCVRCEEIARAELSEVA